MAEQLHTYADGTQRKLQTNPARAIRDHCKYSCCQVDSDNPGSTEAWRECKIETCVLHPFRLGKSPYRKTRAYTDEERQALRDRMTRVRSNEA